MTLDLQLMREAHEESLTTIVSREFGSAGDVLVRRLLDALPKIHSRLPVEMLPDGIVAFAAEDDSVTLEGASGDLSNLSSVDAYPHRGFTVQILAGGFRVLPAVVGPENLPRSVAYQFRAFQDEVWHVGRASLPVFNPAGDQLSPFAVPLFSKLEEALADYAERQVRECRCRELLAAWRDEPRLFWRQRPEEQVRRSLEHHLVSALRAHVEVEHVVDERKESDIWVYWSFAEHAALIECKWMGKSASEADAVGHRQMTEFSAADAVAGLHQLADYLDRQRPRADGRAVRGHLVVIDGRRRGLTMPDGQTPLSNEDLLYYEYRDVVWPAELLARTDLASPRRMYCRPRV